jgi:type II secretory pathway pseudopilin PulG
VIARLAILRGADREAGLTLVELLVASAMSVILVGAACAMLISAVRDQPKLSKKDQAVTTARYVLERMTREIRNGTSIDAAASNGAEVSFTTQLRRTECGGAVQEDPSVSAIECRVTYRCTASECTRTETDPEVKTGGTPQTIVSGLDSDEVFSYEPPEEPTYIGVTLHIANPEGDGDLKISDGAGLRILDYARQ